MPAAKLNSPFTCDSIVQTFPDEIIPDRIVIRVDDADATAKVVICINGETPSAANADAYLLATESFELRGRGVTKASKIKILNLVGNPLIYFAMT